MKASKRKLEIAMAKARMNPKDVAQKAGIAYQSVRRVCVSNGVKPATFGKIADALGCEVSEILHIPVLPCSKGTAA